jgi:LacI family transcriptional regulator
MPGDLTIYDIARAAGTSPRTVSRYFNHPELLASCTRERIARLVEGSGFRPSEIASRLSNRGQGAVAVMAWVGQGPPSELHQHLLGLVAADLARRGRDLLLIGLTDGNLATAIAQHLERRKLESALLLNRLPEAVQDALAAAGVPTVSLNWQPEYGLRRNRYVGIDYYESMRSFAMLLLGAGHRRLAWVGGSGTDDRRRQALRDVTAAAGRTLLAVEPADDAAGWDDRLQRVLADGATLAVCWCDVAALALLAAARRAGVAVPDRLAITGFDGIAAGELVHPTLTTVVQPWAAMATHAAAILAGEDPGHHDHLLATTPRWGGTCTNASVG